MNEFHEKIAEDLKTRTNRSILLSSHCGSVSLPSMEFICCPTLDDASSRLGGGGPGAFFLPKTRFIILYDCCFVLELGKHRRIWLCEVVHLSLLGNLHLAPGFSVVIPIFVPKGSDALRNNRKYEIVVLPG
jgi:hypothetical protein